MRSDTPAKPPPAVARMLSQASDIWLARGAVLLIAGLQLLMINNLTIGPKWLAPGLELTLLAPLSVATAWTHAKARDAVTDAHWRHIERARRLVRTAALYLTALVTLINFLAVADLVRMILLGDAHRLGQTLLLDAINLWITNVIVFGLWYWSIDHGGPAAEDLARSKPVDFLFPQMSREAPPELRGWRPGFFDYLYLSFTNASAFSPADTYPLTGRAKLLMLAEAVLSLVTIVIIASRAIGTLM